MVSLKELLFFSVVAILVFQLRIVLVIFSPLVVKVKTLTLLMEKPHFGFNKTFGGRLFNRCN